MLLIRVLQALPLVIAGLVGLAGYFVFSGMQAGHDDMYGPRLVATCTFTGYCEGGDCSAPLPAPVEMIRNGPYGRNYAGVAGGRQPQLHSWKREEGQWREVYAAAVERDSDAPKALHVWRLYPDNRFDYRLVTGDTAPTGETLDTGTGSCGDYVERYEEES